MRLSMKSKIVLFWDLILASAVCKQLVKIVYAIHPFSVYYVCCRKLSDMFRAEMAFIVGSN